MAVSGTHSYQRVAFAASRPLGLSRHPYICTFSFPRQRQYFGSRKSEDYNP